MFTADAEHGVATASRIRTGTITVNGFRHDSGLPFGGFKQSGLRRELGPEGLAAYLELQTIHLPEHPGASA